MFKKLLIISESRKRPLTGSLLYKQIVRFFEEEKITDKFEIAFITINHGVIDGGYRVQGLGYSQNQKSLNPKRYMLNPKSLPPQRFRSGGTWVKKEGIEGMANNIVDYLQTKSYDPKPIAYVRGSYLEAVRLAVRKSGIEIKEIFTEKELAKLKKKGIKWMKVGLRMEEAFTIFKRRIKEILSEESNQTKNNQLRLPI